MEINLTVNGKPVTAEVDGDMPLLWLLRDWLQFNGTKYSCGTGICGACMVHVDGEAVAACKLSVSSLSGKAVTTIEGLAKNPSHPVIDAFISEQVTQCGYCQPGMVMAAISLLRKNPHPSDQDIDQALAQNLCRCGTYQRVRRAIHVAAKTIATNKLTGKDF
jgi:aerobic-type carbon monoxide dehydrogenase small subunit (CoxS/CutS family)